MTPPPLTWLYAPGDRPRVVAKALAAGADVVVIDLEDAVAPDRKQIGTVADATGGPPLYALLESALGVERAYPIAAAHPSLRGIALGEADLRADLGVGADAGLDWSRSRVIVAARAAGLAPPCQSVYPDTRDLEGLAASCAHGRALGFLGRAAIHPRQLPVIERAYLPTHAQLEEAETVLKAAAREQGAQALPDGRFIDAAVAAAAQRTLSLSRWP